MAQTHFDAATPGEPAWDLSFTQQTQGLHPEVAACALGLARRFRAIGLGIDTQVRPTPRGLSTFLALVGQRGLICIVDLTLVDHMLVAHRGLGQGPGTVLDIRLLDGCGDVVADGMSCPVSPETMAAQAQVPEQLERAAIAIYVAAMAHFELLRPVARHA